MSKAWFAENKLSKEMFLYVFKIISIATVTLAIVAMGISLDCLYKGDLHFPRSGALLVLVALMIALYRESKKTNIDNQYLKNMELYTKQRIELGEVRLRSYVMEIRYDIDRERMTASRAKLQELRNNSRKYTDEQNKKIKESISILEKMESSGAQFLGQKRSGDAELPLHEEKLKEDIEELVKRQEALLSRAKITHVGELGLAICGTLIWAYGDLVFDRFVGDHCSTLFS